MSDDIPNPGTGEPDFEHADRDATTTDSPKPASTDRLTEGARK